MEFRCSVGVVSTTFSDGGDRSRQVPRCAKVIGNGRGDSQQIDGGLPLVRYCCCRCRPDRRPHHRDAPPVPRSSGLAIARAFSSGLYRSWHVEGSG